MLTRDRITLGIHHVQARASRAEPATEAQLAILLDSSYALQLARQRIPFLNPAGALKLQIDLIAPLAIVVDDEIGQLSVELKSA